jgi:predicted dehydrogenase
MSTHEFSFKEAPLAYDLLISKSEPFIGIALKYDIKKTHSKSKIIIKKTEGIQNSKVNISFIGAGSYAQSNLLPYIRENSKSSKIGVLTNSGTTSKRVAEKFKFNFCATLENDVFDDNTNTVFVATRHDSHGEYVLKALKNNKHVFVEKPLCLKESELDKIVEAKQQSRTALMIGFNRRFSPLTKKIIDVVGSGPMSMIYRINAGVIPKDTWIQDMEVGGGRILGEVCHFIDYLTYVNGSLPNRVSAQVLPDPGNLNDTVNILLQFENGSTGVVCYYANGSKSLTKEYIEIFSSGTTAILNDFKELRIYGKGKPNKTKLLSQNKGQKEMVQEFINGIVNNGNTPIKFSEIVAVTRASFKVLESISKNGTQIEVL